MDVQAITQMQTAIHKITIKNTNWGVKRKMTPRLANLLSQVEEVSVPVT